MDDDENEHHRKSTLAMTSISYTISKRENLNLCIPTQRKVFQSDVYQDRVEFWVIDDAHLVKEWGSDFHPDFGKLAQLGSLFPSVPILAPTAMAPQKRI